MEKFAIIGGAGFIGSHFAKYLISQDFDVLVIDNFCSGTLGHLHDILENPKFKLLHLDVEHTAELEVALKGYDTVIHLASNPDIAKAMVDPRIDFVQGTVLTESVLEASRRASVKTILYASGSGVYGDAGEKVLSEKDLTVPISTYGASKLAGESLLAAYNHMFGIRTKSFRFANVVGPMQTHGVTFDFINKLKKDPTTISIMGNGTQKKSYVNVMDIISGVLLVHNHKNNSNQSFNISYDNYLSVKEILLLVLNLMELDLKKVNIEFGEDNRGWKGDVPVVYLDSTKIKSLGWKPLHTSESAIENAIKYQINNS
jgi:UDP-glucose 4-epimerase